MIMEPQGHASLRYPTAPAPANEAGVDADFAAEPAAPRLGSRPSFSILADELTDLDDSALVASICNSAGNPEV